uniref:Uncharacterized protein n=1 Tax=Meloidogyne hapla TaxID=6305 RepID=A0A1I8B116_MELHA
MSIGSNDSTALLATSTIYKKRHPQLLKLVPARAQSCADFSSRLQLLPSSMAAAASSAKQIRDSGSSPQFIPFSPNNNSLSTKVTTTINIRPMSNSTPSATTTGYNSSPSLSPQRKVSRSARLCHSFRRTLRRNSPGGKKALAQTDSNASAPTGLLFSLGEQQQDSELSKKGSQVSIVNSETNERTSSFSLRQQQQKESRILPSEVPKRDDSVEQTPEKNQKQHQQQSDDNRRNSSSSPLSREF